jgi:hypothetical protein
LSPDWSHLPQIYKNAITTTQNDQKNQINRIMFNMFQYFCYCFSLCPTFVTEKIDKRLQLSVDQQYYDLLLQYLDFFLPCYSLISATPCGKAMISKTVQETLDDSNIFKCNALENLSRALNVSQFFLNSLIEMWLCQNDYELLESPGLKVPIYLKPNQYLVRGISILVKRLVDMDLSTINDDQTSRVYLERHSGQTHLVYDINKSNTYKSLSIKLFRFLCNAMQYWSNDDSVADLIDIWLLYAFPWQSKNQCYSPQWSNFVQDNFLYYTKLLQLFINRCLSFDFYASARPAMKRHPVQTNSLKYLNIVEKVLEYFDDHPFSETVRSIERALLSLKSYAPTPLIGSPMLSSKTPLLPATPKSTKDGPNASQTYRNTGPKTRLAISQFEGTYRYSPIFEDSDRENFLVASNRLIARLWDTSERLVQIKLVKSEPKLEESHSFSPSNFIQSTYYALLGDVISTKGSSLGSDQLRQLENNCARIRKSIDRLCDLLGLVNPSVSPLMNMRRSASDVIGADDEGDIHEWAPGVCEPQRIREMGNTLTLRGRCQVRLNNLD